MFIMILLNVRNVSALCYVQSDVMIVAGTLTNKMAPALRKVGSDAVLQ